MRTRQTGGSQTCDATEITQGASKNTRARVSPSEILIYMVWGVTWAPEFIKCLQVILMHKQVWEPCHKGSIWPNGPQVSPFLFLKGTFPGHSTESSPHWGPSLLSPFCPALCWKSYITAQSQFGLPHPSPMIKFQTVIHAGPASRHLPSSASRSQLGPPSCSCVTKPDTSISSHWRASMDRT